MKSEKQVRSSCNFLNGSMRPLRFQIVLASACIFFLMFGKHTFAQYAGAGTNYQQSTSTNQSATQTPCYLGGTGQSGGTGQMPGADGYSAQTPDYGQYGQYDQYGPNSQYGQQGGYSQQRAYAQQGEPSWSNQAQPYGQYSMEQQPQSSPYSAEQWQQEAQFPTYQSGMRQTFGQPVIPAAQIIAIIERAPYTLPTFKDLAGQQYGVDPSTIPDAGVYNCIRQDPNFRSQVINQLIDQGYIANPLQPMGQMGTSIPPQSSYPMNRGISQGYPPLYPYPSSLGSIPPYQPRPSEQPSELRRLTPIPYPHLPSLHSLYSQEVPANARLRRFGSDAFLFGGGNTNLLPMDLPVGPNYVLGPGDNLIVNMWGGQSARLIRTVDRQGEVELPEAGTVIVSGLTIAQAQVAIQKALGTQFQDEHVELSLGRVRTVRVYVVGDVQRPGAYDVSSLSTPLNALYAAGGPTSRGSLRILKQYRGKKLVQTIDLYDFLLHGVRTDLDRLMPGDTILVPPVGPQVAVAGMVRRPAIYELKGKEEDLKDVLKLAGGVLPSADLKEIRVERVVTHERHTMLRVQLPDGAKGEANLPPFEVQDGDYIEVSPILPYNNQVVYLEGHVFKPGRYAWREGMTVRDLLHSYRDVMPEPATEAEVVRLMPPDLHPETMLFNLRDVLAGDDPITLEPFDTVRIFGRYQIDAPKVSIFGPVLRPGVYPMSHGMTVSDLIDMAGGFRRSAYRRAADLSSYVVKNGQRVLLRYSTVNLSKALDGDKQADVALQPGDVLGIRQLTGWKDIGASITISGEVKYAGTYGIENGERLSSVLERAGGFRADAFPQGAILERAQVRQMEEVNRQEMIQRIQSTAPNVRQGVNSTSQDELNLLQAMQQQRQQVLTALRSNPPTGRLVISISSNIRKWANTPEDIVVRPGDRLIIPKRPDFVLVAGQVYNATGITFRPGKDAGWYLRQAGGVTASGDKRKIFILRANGSVVASTRSTIFEGGILGVKMRPGDSIIVPEKIVGGSQVWRNVIGSAQIASSVAITGAVAGVF